MPKYGEDQPGHPHMIHQSCTKENNQGLLEFQ